MIPRQIGRYIVQRHLGSGGMGDVYLASDTQLNRPVALKFLPPDFAADAGRRERFLREAQIAAALSHPHVATVFEVLEHEGNLVLAMEYVEGETLRKAISRGPLPLRSVLRLGAQVSDALAAAHRRGAVHRDIKPENIMIMQDGLAKVLDFGLARGYETQPAVSNPDGTTVGTLTEAGKVVGTLGYVSPEQLQGRRATPESDIFALGATLYEAATGTKPFPGKSDVEVLAALLRDQPPPASSVNEDVPPDFDSIVNRALAKEPADRYHDARDVATDLRALRRKVESSDSTSASMQPATRRTRSAVRLTASVALLATVAIVAWWFAGGRSPARGRFAGARMRLLLSVDGAVSDPALSADGKMLAYVASEGGHSDLYIARTAGGGKVRLTDDAVRDSHPAFSPDGERLAFARFNPETGVPDLFTMPSMGGDMSSVARGATAPAWAPDGMRLAFVRWTEGSGHVLVVARADGSEPSELLRSDANYPFLRSVSWSPDAETLAVVRSQGGLAAEIWTVPSAGGAPRRLIEQPPGVFADSPCFTPDGKDIVFMSNRAGATNLWMIAAEGRGEPERLTTGTGPDASPSVARDGRIVFENSHSRSALLLLRPASGEVRELARHGAPLWAPSFSPDGRIVAFSRAEDDGAWHIWLIPAGGGEPRRITSGTLPEIYPKFTPDGRFVVFSTWSPGPDRVWRVSVEGGPPEALTPERSEDDGYPDVAPDGRLAFTRIEDGVGRVHVASAGGGDVRRLTASPSTVPSWSPDGAWIAFGRDRSYEGGISVIRADGTGERRLTAKGGWPVWMPDGRRIAYQANGPEGNAVIRAIAAEGGEATTLKTVAFRGTNFPFAFSRDGTQFVTTNALQVGSELWILEP